MAAPTNALDQAHEAQQQANKPNFILCIKLGNQGADGTKIRKRIKQMMNSPARGWGPQNHETSQFYWKRIDAPFGYQDARILVSEIEAKLREEFHGDWLLRHLLTKPVAEFDDNVAEADLEAIFGGL